MFQCLNDSTQWIEELEGYRSSLHPFVMEFCITASTLLIEMLGDKGDMSRKITRRHSDPTLKFGIKRKSASDKIPLLSSQSSFPDDESDNEVRGKPSRKHNRGNKSQNSVEDKSRTVVAEEPVASTSSSSTNTGET